MNTLQAATTFPIGAMPEGSLQVFAVSPLRAAGFLLMNTVALPATIAPLFDGGTWNGPPTGMWGGVLVAVEPTVAAGILLMFTLGLTLPSMIPLNG
jgi:hypothetical protein